jgi:hypothetical protein
MNEHELMEQLNGMRRWADDLLRRKPQLLASDATAIQLHELAAEHRAMADEIEQLAEVNT